MESLKGKTGVEDLYKQVSDVIERMKLPWSKLANVTTDGSPNLTEKKTLGCWKESKIKSKRKTLTRMLFIFTASFIRNLWVSPYCSLIMSLTDQHLGSILRIATTKLTPDFHALPKKGDQKHCYHWNWPWVSLLCYEINVFGKQFVQWALHIHALLPVKGQILSCNGFYMSFILVHTNTPSICSWPDTSSDVRAHCCPQVKRFAHPWFTPKRSHQIQYITTNRVENN